MATRVIQDARLKLLNDKDIKDGEYILYWMQCSQRSEYNHALEYAIQQTNDLKKPLLVVFGLMDNYSDANLRHYTFMLEGLRETQNTLESRGIKMVVQHGDPAEVALHTGEKASLIVCDRGYQRQHKAWRNRVAKEANCLVAQVESDAIVPVEVVSDKAEYAARTIRPKIKKHLNKYLVELGTTSLDKKSLSLSNNGLDLKNIESVLTRLNIDRSVLPVNHRLKGGASEAKKILRKFINERLRHYRDNRNQPQTDYVSYMSPYLHFGQISPLYVALQVKDAHDIPQIDKEAFLEELTVRRELAINFVHYTHNYDSFSCLPDWAKKTLLAHKNDKRTYQYTRKQLVNAEIHDEYWNAAMREMKYTGYMHNYMRMYWGKKILEWCNTPEYAYQTALAINNKYFLDGRDPNSYSNIAWLFGLHDRPWKECPVFGKVRYMSARGLEQKFDTSAYIEKIGKLIQER